jgi:hypothetical protein
MPSIVCGYVEHVDRQGEEAREIYYILEDIGSTVQSGGGGIS